MKYAKTILIGIFIIGIVAGFLFFGGKKETIKTNEETNILKGESRYIENYETIYNYPTPEIGTEIPFWDYIVANNNGHIIITRQESACDIYATYRTCQHEFQFMLSDGTKMSMHLTWNADLWSTDIFHFNSSSPEILTFGKIKPSAVTAKYSEQFNLVNRTWQDIHYDEITGEEYIETIIIPEMQFYNWRSVNLNRIKNTLKNQDLFV